MANDLVVGYKVPARWKIVMIFCAVLTLGNVLVLTGCNPVGVLKSTVQSNTTDVSDGALTVNLKPNPAVKPGSKPLMFKVKNGNNVFEVELPPEAVYELGLNFTRNTRIDSIEKVIKEIDEALTNNRNTLCVGGLIILALFGAIAAFTHQWGFVPIGIVMGGTVIAFGFEPRLAIVTGICSVAMGMVYTIYKLRRSDIYKQRYTALETYANELDTVVRAVLAECTPEVAKIMNAKLEKVQRPKL